MLTQTQVDYALTTKSWNTIKSPSEKVNNWDLNFAIWIRWHLAIPTYVYPSSYLPIYLLNLNIQMKASIFLFYVLGVFRSSHHAQRRKIVEKCWVDAVIVVVIQTMRNKSTLITDKACFVFEVEQEGIIT